jgi:hypothetical protein
MDSFILVTFLKWVPIAEPMDARELRVVDPDGLLGRRWTR